MPESGMMPRHRDGADRGPSDVKLIPDPNRLAELLAQVKAAEQALAEVQGNEVVSAGSLQLAVDAGHPDAKVFLDALHAIEARHAAAPPTQAA